ncbi:MaoC/PaaZ C-terminal domain-containing protein [Rhodococcus qingshengii]|uniref:MaoC/PaaZ C-terminal domain-containing protein n=1 Tax=Rhodococcus qingshengii TaxID=334542 RepID=UPI0022B235EF|nr:MaoC/PaaZ C-terminal domain-containing protein [Rhodococcus qingshengii]
MTDNTRSKLIDLDIGYRTEQVIVENLPRVTMVQYAGVSGDYNPIHTDEVYARKVSDQPSVIAHGMWTMGAVGRLVTDLVGDGTLTSYSGRFVGQLRPGDDLIATADIVAVDTVGDLRSVRVEVVARNQHGADIFKGHAVAQATL